MIVPVKAFITVFACCFDSQSVIMNLLSQHLSADKIRVSASVDRERLKLYRDRELRINSSAHSSDLYSFH